MLEQRQSGQRRAFGDPAERVRGGFTTRGDERGAGQHDRAEERTGGQGAPQFLEDHGLLDGAVASTAEVLRNGQGERA